MSAPRLLLMDEPSMGLAPILVERSFEIIKQVHEAGVAVLVVEQNANVSLSIADRGYVLQTGRVVLADKANACSRTRICYLAGTRTLPLRNGVRPGAEVRSARTRPARPLRTASATGSRSSSGSSTSTAARRARSRTRCAPPTTTTSRLGREGRALGVLGRARRGGARELRRLVERRRRTRSRSRRPSRPASARSRAGSATRGGRRSS